MRGLKLVRVTEQQAAEHYVEHVGKPFYPELVEFITSGPVVAMVIEGLGAVATVRAMMGATNPLDSAPGTIRGDFALDLGRERRPRLRLARRPPRARSRSSSRTPSSRDDPRGARAARAAAAGVALAPAARDPDHARHRVRGGRRRTTRSPTSPGAPAEIAVAHARAKAASVDGERVLGVDTIVVIDGRVLGKPADEDEAREYLGLLSGRTHTVHSGLCLRAGGVEHVRSAVTDVTFAPLDAERRRLVPRHPASGASAPAATPCRGAGRRSCDRSPATTRTSSACPSRR